MARWGHLYTASTVELRIISLMLSSLGLVPRAQLPAVNGFGLDDELRVALHEPDSAQALDTAKAERISLAARA